MADRNSVRKRFFKVIKDDVALAATDESIAEDAADIEKEIDHIIAPSYLKDDFYAANTLSSKILDIHKKLLRKDTEYRGYCMGLISATKNKVTLDLIDEEDPEMDDMAFILANDPEAHKALTNNALRMFKIFIKTSEGAALLMTGRPSTSQPIVNAAPNFGQSGPA